MEQSVFEGVKEKYEHVNVDRLGIVTSEYRWLLILQNYLVIKRVFCRLTHVTYVKHKPELGDALF